MAEHMSAQQRQQIEQRLRDRRQVLRAEIRETLLRTDAQRYAAVAGQLEDSADQSLAAVLAGIAQADIERDAQEISDIEAALHRLDAGTYGDCVACGTRIPAARLDAYPTAKRCRPCQQQHEQAHGAARTAQDGTVPISR
jgi:RNA polymerase-binding transcription factor DksA